MKRIKLVGLCLIVAGAFAAIAGASSAAAAGPEWGICVAHKNGKYPGSTCTTEKKGKEKGHYEWAPADSCYSDPKKGNFTESACKTVATKKGKPDHKGAYELAPSPTYTSTTGTATLKSALGSITCTSSVDEGEITSGTTDKDSVQFFGCSTLGQTCLNTVIEGKPSIATEVLPTTLGESGGKVVNTFGDGPSGYSAIFACENVGYFRTSGSTCGTVSPLNVSGTSSTTDFEEGSACQALVTEYSTSPTFSEPVTVPAEEVTVGTDTTSVPIELKS